MTPMRGWMKVTLSEWPTCTVSSQGTLSAGWARLFFSCAETEATDYFFLQHCFKIQYLQRGSSFVER
jgi:hypothetical protein